MTQTRLILEPNCVNTNRFTKLFYLAIVQGDSVAKETLSTQIIPELRDSIANTLGPAELSQGLAESSASAAMIKALERADTFDFSELFLPWIGTIATHEVVNGIREVNRGYPKNRRSLHSVVDVHHNGRSVPGRSDVPDTKTFTPLDELIRREDRARHDLNIARLDAAILRLPDQERQVVNLRLAGLTNPAIGHRLHLKAKQVASIYCRATKKLHRWIG